jgi:hypothetical protein
VSFKFTGEGATFEEDLAIKLDYGGGERPQMLSEIMSAVRYINEINVNPTKFWLKTVAIHTLFILVGYKIVISNLLAQN